MAKLQGKIALITGGTTGIGAATAKLFQSEGATVIVTGSNPATLAQAREELPGVEIIGSDGADTAATKALIDTVKGKHGRIDILFVNAGIARFAPAEFVDEAFFDAQFNLNVRGAYFAIKYGADAVPAGGSIILTASVSGVKGQAGGTVYGATKAALRSFGRTFAAELAPKGVRVNTISPGPIETPIFGKTGLTPDQIKGFQSQMISAIPLARMGHADEVARAALYLAADATYTTGAELFVDGGLVDI
jgi:NAD(P)-dependent dehydrogenase (short-subunit alcohol dehydrogenase family)